MSSDFRDAYNATDACLADMRGLMRALYDQAADCDAVNTSDPALWAINALISVLLDQIQRAMELHEREWAASKAKAAAA